jgi:hypothetical protein
MPYTRRRLFGMSNTGPDTLHPQSEVILIIVKVGQPVWEREVLLATPKILPYRCPVAHVLGK